MSSQLVIVLMALLTTSAPPMTGQGARGQMTSTGEQASSTASYEERKRAFEQQLKSIKLSVAGCSEIPDSYTPVSDSFKEGSGICLRLVFTNISIETVYYSLSDVSRQSRPQLFKERDLVAYRGKSSKIAERGESSDVSIRSIPVSLDPSQSKSIIINLDDWYKPLVEGNYQFSVKWQFLSGGEWVETSPIEFRVEPK